MKGKNNKEIIPVEQRFWPKVNKDTESGCWEWTAGTDRDGYGMIRVPRGNGLRGVNIRSHRFSWSLMHGEIDSSVMVLHKCDNRKCVNPDHLFTGNANDNAKDMVSKGRQKAGPGIPTGFKYTGTRKDATWTPEQEEHVRLLYSQGFKPYYIAEKVGLNYFIAYNIIRRRCNKSVNTEALDVPTCEDHVAL